MYVRMCSWDEDTARASRTRRFGRRACGNSRSINPSGLAGLRVLLLGGDKMTTGEHDKWAAVTSRGWWQRQDSQTACSWHAASQPPSLAV